MSDVPLLTDGDEPLLTGNDEDILVSVQPVALAANIVLNLAPSASIVVLTGLSGRVVLA